MAVVTAKCKTYSHIKQKQKKFHKLFKQTQKTKTKMYWENAKDGKFLCLE